MFQRISFVYNLSFSPRFPLYYYILLSYHRFVIYSLISWLFFLTEKLKTKTLVVVVVYSSIILLIVDRDKHTYKQSRKQSTDLIMLLMPQMDIAFESSAIRDSFFSCCCLHLQVSEFQSDEN